MATISRMRRLVNPGRRRRRNGIAKKVLSPLQKLFFGSKRQRAAVRKNSSIRKSKKAIKRTMHPSHASRIAVSLYGRDGYKKRKRKFNTRRRKRNVGSIITVRTKSNPGRKRRYKRRRKVTVNKGVTMARTRRRRRAVSNPRRRRVYHRRRRRAVAVNPRRRRRRARRNVSYVKRIKRGRYMYSNPGRRRRRARVHHRRHYRRNPGIMTGTMGRVAGMLGGFGATALLTGFVPAGLSTGIMGYISTGVVAVLQGKAVGKIMKSSALGNDFLVGGMAYLAVKVIKDMFGYSIPGFSGMGLIGGSSFYVPQVNRNGSMGSFLLPSAVGGAIASIPTKAGMGVMRRTGRLM